MQKIREAISFYGRVQGVGFRYKLGYLAQMYTDRMGEERI